MQTQTEFQSTNEMEHKAQRPNKVQKCLHTTLEQSFFLDQFLDFENIRYEMENDVEFGYGFECVLKLE